MEASIYKLRVSKEYMIKKLKELEIEKRGKEKRIKLSKKINEDIYEEEITAQFYFDKKIKNKEIKWYNYWAKFFGHDENIYKIVESAYGVIIIEISNSLYAISLGIGYHYANQNSFEDFGFEVAERIIKKDAIKLKSVKFYKQTKNRSLTQFQGTYIVDEVGESHELVIGKLALVSALKDFKLKEYTDDVVFGTAVKINIKNYSPKEIFELIFELHLIVDKMESITSFPRLKLLPNSEDFMPIKSDLDRKLLEDLLDNNSSNISLSYFTEQDSDIIVHSLHSDVEVKYGSKSENAEFNIDSIKSAIRELKCQKIDMLKLKTSKYGDKPRPLKLYLDYSTDYRNEHYCLYKGRWAKFNKSYYDFIDNEIKKVNEITEYLEEFNLSNNLLEKGNEIKNTNRGKYHDNVYTTEYLYNIAISEKFDYVLYDRKFVHKRFKNIEFADLYNKKNKEIIHVKIGDVQDWRYCISQSLQVAPILNLHRNELIKDNVPEVTKMTLLFLVNKKNIFEENRIDFAKNRSLYFKTEIIEWLNVIRQYGFTPRIIVAKILLNNNSE